MATLCSNNMQSFKIWQIIRHLGARVQAEDMEAAEAHFERAWKRFGEAEMLIPEADRGKPMKPMQARPAAERCARREKP